MARFVFTEINGVLVHDASRFTATLLNEDLKAFKPSIVALDKIVGSTGAKVVITSSWRAMGLGGMQDRFRQWGVKSTISDVTPQDISKDVALHHFLKCAHEWGYGRVESFVVLDHERVYSGDIEPFLILTEMRAGLTNTLAEQAIDIVNKRIYSPK